MICYSAFIQEKINIETDRNLDKMIEITKKFIVKVIIMVIVIQVILLHLKMK